MIWDFSGNVYEWVKDNSVAAQAPDGFIALESGWDNTSQGWPGQSDKLNFGPAGNYTSKNSGEHGGLGYGLLNYSSGAVVRGAGWSYGANAGVFAASLGPNATHSAVTIGFRCVATGGS